MSMGEGMRISHYQRPVDLIEIARRGKPGTADPADESASFKEMFSRQLAQSRDVHFSRHAHQRLHSRGLELSDQQLTLVADAIDKADTKGARETLVLTDEAAYVVSVKNRTVITVFDRDNLREGIVTSIDSAVIM